MQFETSSTEVLGQQRVRFRRRADGRVVAVAMPAPAQANFLPLPLVAFVNAAQRVRESIEAAIRRNQRRA